ncbi:MAG: hypothetical protein ACR2PL_16360 [Dehalococcoidia bacterium]
MTLMPYLRGARGARTTTTADSGQHMPQDERIALLEHTLAKYIAVGWAVATRLDARAELAPPDGPERIYLEVSRDGSLYLSGPANLLLPATPRRRSMPGVAA